MARAMSSGELSIMRIGNWLDLLPRAHSYRVVLQCIIVAGWLLGCRDILSTPSIPDGTQSPSTYLSKQGALALTRTTVDLFRAAIWNVTLESGLLTDELSSTNQNQIPLDSRILGLGSNTSYTYLHKLRGQSRMARGVLAEYASDLSPDIRGQLYAFEAYAELWLADLYCSGVPLSTLDYKSDFTYRPSSTTNEVYKHAILLFDSALAIVADSDDLRTLATVGKGRALLSLGRYEEATAVIENVDVTDAYSIRILFSSLDPKGGYLFGNYATASDNEGVNGLFYRTSGDPRTYSDTSRIGTKLIYFPDKYAAWDSTLFTVATGVEAELIKAEAALHHEQPTVFMSILNRLRTTGTYSGIKVVGSAIDTAWNAGSGGIPGLGPLDDPIDANARINLLFAERAKWLFVTGQRQADLRRLVRVYGRNQSNVYPSGQYNAQGNGGSSVTGRYGSNIALQIPAEEKMNPYYQGCLSND